MCFRSFNSDNFIYWQTHFVRNGSFKSFYSLLAGLLDRMRILFASRPIACEMGVLKVFIVRIIFGGRPIACEWVL